MTNNYIRLHIRFRFKTLPYTVGTIEGNIYQLEHFANNRTKRFRQIYKVLIGSSTSYRINRVFTLAIK